MSDESNDTMLRVLEREAREGGEVSRLRYDLYRLRNGMGSLTASGSRHLGESWNQVPFAEVLIQGANAGRIHLAYVFNDGPSCDTEDFSFAAVERGGIVVGSVRFTLNQRLPSVSMRGPVPAFEKSCSVAVSGQRLQLGTWGPPGCLLLWSLYLVAPSIVDPVK